MVQVYTIPRGRARGANHRVIGREEFDAMILACSGLHAPHSVAYRSCSTTHATVCAQAMHDAPSYKRRCATMPSVSSGKYQPSTSLILLGRTVQQNGHGYSFKHHHSRHH